MSSELRIPKSVASLVLYLAIVSQCLSVASAQSLRSDTSLRFVPAESSFYVSVLRNREQYERFAKTNAFEKLRSMPVVRMAVAQIKQEMEEQGIGDFLDAAENQELMSVLCDGVSDEVFVFSDSRFAVWVSAMNKIGNTLNMSRLKALQTGEDPDLVARREVLNLFLKDPELLKAPTTVIGFHLSKVDPAQNQIARLENLLQKQFDAEAPELKDRLTRETIGGGEFLTLRLDGTLVPWDQVLEDADLDDDEVEKLTGKLREAKLTISLGIWQSYLLLSIGEDNSMISKLGQGKMLADAPELAPLTKANGKPVTSVSYVSGDFLRRVSAVDQQIDQMVDAVQTVAPFIPASDEVREGLITDSKKFGEELKARIPEMGALTSYEYLIDDGYERLSYNWSEQKGLDGSKPLTILNHLGGSPIAFFAKRGKAQPEACEFASRWCAKSFEYAEQIGTPFMDEDQVELLGALKQEMTPLLQRIGKANREKLAPAFADGQSAIVLDSKLKSESWSLAMPPSDVELPLPEVVCVYGVSNSQLAKEGFAEYFNVIQEGITKLSELMPDQVQPIQIPPPQSQAIDNGTIFSYPMPPIAGLDERLALNAGLSDNSLAISLVPAATQRLLATNPLSTDDSVIDTDRPLAYAWQFNTAEFIKMVRPWVKYGFEVAADEGVVDEEVESQVHTVLDVVSCVRTCTGIAYFEDDVLVSHSRFVMQDLQP